VRPTCRADPLDHGAKSHHCYLSAWLLNCGQGHTNQRRILGVIETDDSEISRSVSDQRFGNNSAMTRH